MKSWSPFRQERIDSNTTTYHSNWPTGAIHVADARLLAGAYAVEFITTAPVSGRSVSGELTVAATSDRMTDLRGLTERMPLIGWASIDLQPLGYLPLAHPLDRRDPGRPGIQFSVDSESGRMSAIAGNSLEIRHGSVVGRTTHVGVMLYVFAADSSSLVGRWSGGGRAEPGTEGYFCASRLGAPPPDEAW